MDIAKIDKNFSTEAPDEKGFLFRDVQLEPFAVEGLGWYKENRQAWYRLPKTFTTNEVTEGALVLSNQTSGVCVRFRSDAPELMIRAKLSNGSWMSHMPFAGSCGFDCYRKVPNGDLLFNHTVQPLYNQVDLKALLGSNPEKLMCEWVVNFPLYGGVDKVEIGLQEGSTILPPLPHQIKDPILFYGSSITQGGCASRPGNCYSSMLCRKLDAPQINLGFSGNGKGEAAVAEAIAKLKLSAFVFDYDYNAPDSEHLERTHEVFFKIVRKAQPTLPIIIISKCDFKNNAVDIRRREIIRNTFQHAIEADDRYVWYIDGETLFGSKMRDACTVDGCHPNDLGFYRMYKHILPVLKYALKKNG